MSQLSDSEIDDNGKSKKKSFLVFFEHPFILLLAGFLLTDWVGGALVQRWQSSEWNRQQKILFKQKLLDQKYLVFYECAKCFSTEISEFNTLVNQYKETDLDLRSIEKITVQFEDKIKNNAVLYEIYFKILSQVKSDSVKISLDSFFILKSELIAMLKGKFAALKVLSEQSKKNGISSEKFDEIKLDNFKELNDKLKDLKNKCEEVLKIISNEIISDSNKMDNL